MVSPQDVIRMIEENDARFVDLRFTDTRGKEQHVTVPVSHFDEDKFESGHAFDGSSFAGWKGVQASDMLLMPDASTAYTYAAPLNAFAQMLHIFKVLHP